MLLVHLKTIQKYELEAHDDDLFPACYGKHDANTEVKRKRQASVSHTSALSLKLLKKYQPTPAVMCHLTNINIFHHIVNNNNNKKRKLHVHSFQKMHPGTFFFHPTKDGVSLTSEHNVRFIYLITRLLGEEIGRLSARFRRDLIAIATSLHINN